MAKSPLTYAGALALMGKHEHPILKKIDKLLGGAILGGTAIAGPAAWAFIEPKNELIDLIESLLNSAKKRMLGTAGFERRELLAAAHTVLAISAFYDGVSEALGPGYRLLRLSDEEKLQLAGMDWPSPDGFVQQLLSVHIPLPSIDAESETRIGLNPLYLLASTLVDFVQGLAVADKVMGDSEPSIMASVIVERAGAHYRDAYLGFAVDVPEFALWISWTSDAATRTALQATRADIMALLSEQSNSLRKLHDLLALTATGERSGPRPNLNVLATKARAVLTKPLLRFVAEENAARVAFPTVERGFVTPRFRHARYAADSLPANNSWWDRHAAKADLDGFLTTHLISMDSSSLPLLVLGDPGAGKSLLTEVLAAQLPTELYTVFRVELRDVAADKKIHQQISEAMTEALEKEVQWGQLTEECGNTIRVVILDGFDELLLATGVTRSGYLEEVAEFQRSQLDAERPVVVIVTSRTLVADRARIPHGTMMIKLEEFDDKQIETWLKAWNAANTATTGFRELTATEVTHHRDLAVQPLLLLILAIYAAELGEERLDSEELSDARLYQRLLDTFIRRQVEKSPKPLSQRQISELASYQRWQLSMTAFGMYNRGRQHITEAELELDLTPFTQQTAAERRSFDERMTEAEQTISSFFFIQGSRATESRAGRSETYEFLHSTFAEYLIAEHTMALLVGLAGQYARASADGFPVRDVPDDDRVFALLCHQALIKRRPIITFARTIHGRLSQSQRSDFADLLIELLRRAATKQEQRKYERYEPTPFHSVTRLANYTANLVTLLIMTSNTWRYPLDLAPTTSKDPLRWWRSMVTLWESGLDEESWAAILSGFTLSRNLKPIFITDFGVSAGARERLLGRHYGQLQKVAGAAVLPGSGDEFATEAEAGLYRDLINVAVETIPTAPLDRLLPVSEETFANIAQGFANGVQLSPAAVEVFWRVLARHARQLPYELVNRLTTSLLNDAARYFAAASNVAGVVAAHPRLLMTTDIEQLTVIGAPDAHAAVTMLWQAEQGRVDPELTALRDFRRWIDEHLARRIIHDLTGVLPEFLTYLRVERPSYWEIDGDDLLSLSRSSGFELRRVAPVDADYLLTAALGGFRVDRSLSAFIVAFLTAHGQPVDDEADIDALVRQLATYAELPWERP